MLARMDTTTVNLFSPPGRRGHFELRQITVERPWAAIATLLFCIQPGGSSADAQQELSSAAAGRAASQIGVPEVLIFAVRASSPPLPHSTAARFI